MVPKLYIYIYIYIYIYKQHYLQMDKNNGIPFEREEQDSWLVDLIALVIKKTHDSFPLLDGWHKFCLFARKKVQWGHFTLYYIM
jgi:hypothetical protein